MYSIKHIKKLCAHAKERKFSFLRDLMLELQAADISEIFEDIPDDIYALFVVMNGKGNNMNQYDAERFAEKVNAKITIPTHWGLHDELYPVDFKYKKVVVPEIYKEISLED